MPAGQVEAFWWDAQGELERRARREEEEIDAVAHVLLILQGEPTLRIAKGRDRGARPGEGPSMIAINAPACGSISELLDWVEQLEGIEVIRIVAYRSADGVRGSVFGRRTAWVC